MAQVGETELNIQALARALWRRVWLLVLVAVAVAAGVYYALGFVDPLYTADTRILIEERESPFTRQPDSSAGAGAAFDESAILSQVEVLRSREIANAVIAKLDLTRRPEFDPARSPSMLSSLLIMLGLEEHPTDASIEQRVMEGYFERLSVYPIQKSRVIGVEFSATDPAAAAEVANAVTQSFVALQQDAKRQSAVAATEWLQQEIERLRGRVAEAEQAVADYRTNRGLFDVEQRGMEGSSLSTQQLGDINAELARARAARAEAEARAAAVQTLLDEGGALDSSTEVLNSQLVQRLRERQVALRAQVAELSTTLLPGHPRIRSLEGQVANLEEQIRQEAAKILTSLQTAARVAAARENSLVASLDAAKGDVSRSNDEEIELRALEREAAAQRELLESFLARYREAAARTDANYLPADARIISYAIAPRQPSFPKKVMMAVAAAVAALLLTTALLLLREFTSGRAFRVIGYGVPYTAAPAPAAPVDRTPPAAIDHVADPPALASPATEPELPFEAGAANPAESAEAVEESTASQEDAASDDDAEKHRESAEAALAAAMTASDSPPEVALAAAMSADDIPSASAEVADAETAEAQAPEKSELPDTPMAVETDHAGVAELAEIVASPAVRLALFSGAKGGEGAGEIAYSAARIAARQNVRCILIDVGRKPSAALGLERPGLGDLLSGDVAFGEAIRRDEEEGVHVIPLGMRGSDAPMQRIRLVVNALTHTYDKVIVVADGLDDWPDEFIRPDIAAVVCGPEATEATRNDIYDAVIGRGARNAVIVSYGGDADSGDEESAAA